MIEPHECGGGDDEEGMTSGQLEVHDETGRVKTLENPCSLAASESRYLYLSSTQLAPEF